MDHSFILIVIKNHSLFDSTQCDDVQSWFGQDTEIFFLLDDEASNFTLPQLERFVSEKSDLIVLFVMDIHYNDIVCVDIDRFERNNQLFETMWPILSWMS